MGKSRGGDTQRPDAAQPPGVTRVVVIGASAGGLEALQELLGPLQPGTGSAYLIAQHLAPGHPSLIVELLGRATSLPVRVAVDGLRLEPDTIVVAPPNNDLTILGDVVHLAAPGARFGPSPSVDLLFTSVAEQWGSRSVAVVLSGTGSDGAHGLRDVRGAGGLTLVQSPASARFDGMPRSAISLGGADLVADVTELGKRLAAQPPDRIEWVGQDLPAPAADMLSSITNQVRRATGIDFAQYKESTLDRQVRRRMAIRQVSDIDDYFALLVQDPDEAHALSSNLLVTVTSFFRDPLAFEALHARLADYVAEHVDDDPIRVWVPGCASGEEAYTIGMIISDVLGHPADLSRHLKIFATDLDETSLAIARRAHYAPTAALSIPDEYRSRFITETPEGGQVAEVLRECTVFARHDVAQDPPFPRIDLISCRNTLIYFTEPLQEVALGMFAFALRPGGLLLLGKSENLARTTLGFAVLDADRRIFVRNNEPAPLPQAGTLRAPDRSTRALVSPIPRIAVVRDAVLEHHTELLEALVRSSGRIFLILDEDHNLVEVVGDVSPYCRVPEGRATSAAGSFLRPELQEEARALFLLSRTSSGPATGRVIHLTDPDIAVRLEASRLPVATRQLIVLAFLPVPDAVADEAPVLDRGEAFDREIVRLERELLGSQDVLRRSLAELQAANEELEASAEELQAASEELQASNEELEASNEELQATNEELSTLNQEQRQRADVLQGLNSDLENIQSSLSQGMIIVDGDLRITRFTPLAVRVFALLENDFGRLLTDIPTTLPMPEFAEALRSVAAGEPRRTIEIGNNDVSYLLQVLPYQDPDGRRRGAIVTLTDVTEMVALRSTAAEAFSRLEGVTAQLMQQATYDSVTGQLTRAAFTQGVNRELSRAARSGTNVALAWIDIDRFKEINDQYGHEAGDTVLRTAAERIAAAVRGTDLVGRLGGDEFGVLLTNYQQEGELDVILERVIEALAEPMTLRDAETTVSGSLGVALYPRDESALEGLMRAADAAMYVVKRSGGDHFAYFSAEMNEAAELRHTMRRLVEQGMTNGEFEVFYQPIVRADDGKVWGVESLIRWHRDGEIVPAADFITFCQESGQIRALGLLTLTLLRADITALRDAGHVDLSVAVNMSAEQLADPHLAGLLTSWPVPGGLESLVIEVVESVFLPSNADGLATVQELSALGAGISIDDYGSGYSNIRLVKELSPDFVKLDRTFLGPDSEMERVTVLDVDRALIRSAIEMAHAIGAEVVAEGIEDAATMQAVTDLGADYIQGYHIARAMPLADLLLWLDGRTTAG